MSAYTSNIAGSQGGNPEQKAEGAPFTGSLTGSGQLAVLYSLGSPRDGAARGEAALP